MNQAVQLFQVHYHNRTYRYFREQGSPPFYILLVKILQNFYYSGQILNIKIEDEILEPSKDAKIFGIYDPAENDFDLNMWSETKAEDLRSSLNRLKKIELSKSSNEILEAILFSFSYPPQGMTEKEFVDLKINWMIEHDPVSYTHLTLPTILLV